MCPADDPDRKAGYKASDCLKATLVAQLKSKGLQPNAQSGLLRAIRLCERFNHHSGGSQAELLVLLKQVKKLFDPDNPGKVRDVHRPLPVASLAAQLPVRAELDAQSNCSISRQSSIDSGMPRMLVEARAHAKGSAYGTIARLQDERARQDDIAARAQRAQRQADMCLALQVQLQEAASKRQAERAERSREGAALTLQMAQFQAEQEENREKRMKDAAALKKVYEAQVEEARKRAQAEAEARAREAALFRQELACEQLQEQQAKADKAAADAAAFVTMVAANEQQVARRAAEADRSRVEEREYGRRYQEMLRGWEELRAASAAAFAAKSLLAYEAAGGEALCKRMEEQARLDEERAREQEAEREAREDATRARREEERWAREQATLAVLNRQVAERKRIQEEEKAAERHAAETLAAQRRADADAAQKSVAEEHVRKRADLAEKETATRLETRLRFEAANEVMGARESQIHSSVLSGAKSAFNYFSGRLPVSRSGNKASKTM